jgi:hypothetical protein
MIMGSSERPNSGKEEEAENITIACKILCRFIPILMN